MSRRLTYAELFDLLRRLGFREVSNRAFHHEESDTLVAFSARDPNAPVSGGDLLSAETNLRASGLIKGSLEERLRRVARGGGTDSGTSR